MKEPPSSLVDLLPTTKQVKTSSISPSGETRQESLPLAPDRELHMYIEHTVVSVSRGRPQRIPHIYGNYGDALEFVRRKIRRAAHTTSCQIYRKNELVLEVFYDMGRWMDRGKYA